MRLSEKFLGIFFGVVLFLAAFYPILALPVAPHPFIEARPGERYVISPLGGRAIALVQGEKVVVQASVEMVCQITENSGKWILFKVNGGTIKVGDESYSITGGWWRGYYNKATNTAVYQGWGINHEGERVYFILHSRDGRHTPEGTFMTIKGVFRDPEAVYWRLELYVYRFKIG